MLTVVVAFCPFFFCFLFNCFSFISFFSILNFRFRSFSSSACFFFSSSFFCLAIASSAVRVSPREATLRLLFVVGLIGVLDCKKLIKKSLILTLSAFGVVGEVTCEMFECELLCVEGFTVVGYTY